MDVLINHFIKLAAPTEPDVVLQRLHSTIDGVDQAVQEGPVDKVFEVAAKVGAAVKTFGADVTPAGVEGDPGEELAFTVVDDVKPKPQAAPTVTGKEKKFPAAVS